MTLTYRDTVEHGNFKHSAEASTLGFPPGKWPASIPTDMGNGQPFVYVRQEIADEDLIAVHYKQMLGCLTLVVFND